ncbi:MAG: aldo/keto reductase [Bacteroidales bacterium]
MMQEEYRANSKRYQEGISFKRCGNSGIVLPRLSLGMWHNFGSVDSLHNATKIARHAFDNGITHFDLANNYGPTFGSAEENLGRMIKRDFKPYRNELVISTKAGHLMWPGPYGDGGSRKYLMSSLDDSLKRMSLDYVDIFYIHRLTPETPLEETMQALVDIVRQGKALYIGISKYPPAILDKAIAYLKEQNVPCLVSQDKYNMMVRDVENGVLDCCTKNGLGFVAFSPLAQGILTNKYIKGIPKGSRASRPESFLKAEQVTPELIEKIIKLNDIANQRGQTLAQMAISWVVRNELVTSAIIGASSTEQIDDNLSALNNLNFSSEELQLIDSITK